MEKIVLLFIILFILVGCTININNKNGKNLDTSDQKIRKINTFHYQLQNAKYEDLKKLNVDILVIDIDDSKLKERELKDLKNNGKIILSYLSIGEAENYRDYWQPNWQIGSPSFIDEENPNWEGNYKVKYWDKNWQSIILEKVEKISKIGYDGAYLDVIDAYEYYQNKGRDSAVQDMINFVKKIRNKGKELNPRFLIIPQNSPELYEFDEYKGIIDGIGKEDIWYDGNEKQKLEETQYVLTFLGKAIKDGKFILAIDYPTEQNKICDFYKKCKEHKFACTVSNRDLDLKEPIICNIK